MKKIKSLALLLVLSMLVASFSLFASAAEGDIFFATDVHGRTDNLEYVLSAVAEDTQVDTVVLGGDYEVTVYDLDDTIAGVFPDAATYFTTGNHDYAGDGLQETGEVFVNDRFALFMIAYDDFKDATAADILSTYLASYNENEATAGKPLFVVSHLPLHQDRGDNYSADLYAELLNEAGADMDIVYLWGHNHTVDRTLYFMPVGDELTPEGGETITLNFTYATAGYIKEDYGLAVQVNDETITFQRYDTYGKYDEMQTVNRIVPYVAPYDCTTSGHIEGEKSFEAAAKAFAYTCSECGSVVRERLSGDCDGNGIVNSADARFAMRCSAGLCTPDATQTAVADVDGNNEVTEADANSILAKAVGLADAALAWAPVPVDENGNLVA